MPPTEPKTLDEVLRWAEAEFKAVGLDKAALAEWIRETVKDHVRRKKWALKGE